MAEFLKRKINFGPPKDEEKIKIIKKMKMKI